MIHILIVSLYSYRRISVNFISNGLLYVLQISWGGQQALRTLPTSLHCYLANNCFISSPIIPLSNRRIRIYLPKNSREFRLVHSPDIVLRSRINRYTNRNIERNWWNSNESYPIFVNYNLYFKKLLINRLLLVKENIIS